MIRHPRSHRMKMTSSLFDSPDTDVAVASEVSGSKESTTRGFAMTLQPHFIN